MAVAQWCVIHPVYPVDCCGSWQEGACIYFLDRQGLPNTGFLNDGWNVCKTTDGGYKWKDVPIHSPSLADSFSVSVSDFVFKDSLTGWFSSIGAYSCYKTTDGGETWFDLPGSLITVGNASYGSTGTGIYYDKKTDGLFISTYGGYNLVSWDEGSTWAPSNVLSGSEATGGFAFNNEDTGLVAWYGYPQDGTWWRTMDGGHSWSQIPFSIACWQPLPIPGTSTYFVLTTETTTTFFDEIWRTDDAGNTWYKIYTFPPCLYPIYNNVPGGSSSFCLRGTIDSMYALINTGCYLSTDQGFSWKSLCGVPESFVSGVLSSARFYVDANKIFLFGVDSLNGGYASDSNGVGVYWMLNIDSMQYFNSTIVGQFADSSKILSVKPGTSVTVNYIPTMDAMVGVDSVHFAIRYVSSSLVLSNLVIPPGWSILDSSTSNGFVNLLITDTSSVALPTPVLQLTFKTYLGSSYAKVYLDSAHLYGHRLNCDCAALSLSLADSVEIDFDGCGDSNLLALMNHAAPFSIESIQPNPAQNEITVTLSGTAQPTIEMYDALGRAQDVRSTSLPPAVVLDVSGVPSGIYYLRLMSDGYVESRSVVVQK